MLMDCDARYVRCISNIYSAKRYSKYSFSLRDNDFTNSPPQFSTFVIEDDLHYEIADLIYRHKKSINMTHFVCCLSVIKLYRAFNKPVAPNLAKYIFNLKFVEYDYSIIKQCIDKYFSHLKYSEEVHPCVINQLKMLWFGKKH